MQLRKLLKQKQYPLLTGATIVGLVATSVAAAKASVKAVRHIDTLDPLETKRETQIRDLKETWRHFIPPVVLASATVGAVLTSARAHAKQAQAAGIAVAVATTAFEEYRDEVRNMIGEKKEREISEKHVVSRSTPPPPELVPEPTKVLCCDNHTQRFFSTTVDAIQKAVNEVNRTAIFELHGTMNEFYQHVGLPGIPTGDDLGWFADRPLEVRTVASKDSEGRPYLSLEFSHFVPV